MRIGMPTILAAALAALLTACGGTARAVPTPILPTDSGLKVLSVDFSGQRAFDLLKRQVDFGPRVPGSRAHEQCREFMLTELGKYCDSTATQSFQAVVNGQTQQFHNITGYIHPDAEKLVLLMAHFDTRPFADHDIPANQNTPIPGANDGASGVAVLLEAARVLHEKLPNEVGILFLLTDGEDTGRTVRDMFKGAEHFAKTMPLELKRRLKFGILLDMIGDTSLNIKPEKNSEGVAPGIYDALLELQEMLGLRGFTTAGQYSILDDHLAFIEQGVKVYDVIDFDFPPWHTIRDTVDQCSAESLHVVGLCVCNLMLNYAAGRFSI
jgi:glutaminyl-peptide cyclotransferase